MRCVFVDWFLSSASYKKVKLTLYTAIKHSIDGPEGFWTLKIYKQRVTGGSFLVGWILTQLLMKGIQAALKIVFREIFNIKKSLLNESTEVPGHNDLNKRYY